MKAIILTVVTAAVTTLSGCASLYTNIEKTGDNTYLVTEIKQGFFSVSGTLYKCQAVNETKMQCTEVASP